MSGGAQARVQSAHVLGGDRDAVAEALFRLGVARGAAVPVWPPKPLPHGLFVSPERGGWVSLWSPLDDLPDWFAGLTATLECAGILLAVDEGETWSVELFRDGAALGEWLLPFAAAERHYLWDMVYESLEAEGGTEAAGDEARFAGRAEEIAASEHYREAMREYREARPDRETLRPFLPPHASLEQAWEVLTAADREQESPDAESSGYAEDYMEAFASYLGIRDAAWQPAADAEALAEGDYEDEEGLPERWREFVVLPVPRLPVLP